MEKYQPFLGQLKIESVQFQGPQESHVGSFAIMYWSVEADAHVHGGATWAYDFTFEPFDGKLTNLLRTDDLTQPTSKTTK